MSRSIRPALVLLFVAACGNNTPGPSDMGTTIHDMTTMPGFDMTFVPPTLTPPAGCVAATVTTATVYNSIISGKCATAGCHSGTTAPNMSGGATAFHSAVVNVSAGRSQLPNLQYAKAGDANNSFILYKVTGQQGKVPAGGAQMPDNGPPYLSATEQCQMYNWVVSGAN